MDLCSVLNIYSGDSPAYQADGFIVYGIGKIGKLLNRQGSLTVGAEKGDGVARFDVARYQLESFFTENDNFNI